MRVRKFYLLVCSQKEGKNGNLQHVEENDRIIAVKLNAEPVNILIVQVYMPTSDYEDEEVEVLYDRIEDVLEEDGKGDTNTIIMGDWNCCR
jgi:exonuclease III